MIHHPYDLADQIKNIQIPSDFIGVWGLGQMGFLLKGADQHIIAIDPVLSNVVAERVPQQAGVFARAFPPPILPDQLNFLDCVMITHEHLDHCDPNTLKLILKASPDIKIIGPLAALQAVQNELPDIAAHWTVPLVDHAVMDGSRKVHAIPAAHYDLEFDDQGNSRYLSFLIEWGSINIFHSGDTIIYPGYFDKLRGLPKANLAMVAINGRDAYRESFDILGNLQPEEAVWMAKELGWDFLIGGHNDLFVFNSIPPGNISNAVNKINPSQKHMLLQPGQLFLYYQ